MSRRYRRGVFTLNNYTDDDEQRLKDACEGPLAVFSYLVYGREKAPTTGTPHLQGYFECSAQVRGSTLKTGVLQRCWFDRARGSADDCTKYCTKDGDFVERGRPRDQGRRSDLVAIQGLIEEGKPEEEIADEYFTRWIVYRRSFAAYRQIKAPKRTPPFADVDVEFIWGATGTGKTHSCYARFPELWRHIGSSTFFDGYAGQATVLFDDVESDTFSSARWLQLLDKYPLTVEIKGGTVDWVPTTILITSNHPLDEFLLNFPIGHKRAFERRVARVVNL